MSDDKSLALLVANQDQRLAAWTEWEAEHRGCCVPRLLCFLRKLIDAENIEAINAGLNQMSGEDVQSMAKLATTQLISLYLKTQDNEEDS